MDHRRSSSIRFGVVVHHDRHRRDRLDPLSRSTYERTEVEAQRSLESSFSSYLFGITVEVQIHHDVPGSLTVDFTA